MKRLPIMLCLPALVLVAACTEERGEGTANSNENIATDDGTMMAPTEMPTTNGNGVPATDGTTDGTMGPEGTGNTGTMDGTGAPGSTTTGGSTGTTGTGMGGTGTTGTTTGGTQSDRQTPPQ